MGKKVLSISFVVVMVGVIVAAIINVVLFPDKKLEKNAGPTGWALEVRDSFATSVEDTLGGREAQLGLAYLTGMKDGLDTETVQMLRLVGLSHIVVASGTHLGIIVEFTKKRFGRISRFAGVLFSLVFIFIFGAIVGWTASITRAAIVAGLSILGWYYGRKFGAGRVILLAMAITLLINPLYIIDVGWQLSFASFAGIMVLEPMLADFFYGRKRPGKMTKRPGMVAQLILASVAAMLMCAPILIYYFGTISAISIVANVLILPTIPCAMGLTLITGLAGWLPSFFLFDWLRFIVVKITTILLDYHLAVVELFSREGGFILQFGKYNPLVFLLYVPILMPFIIMAIRRAKQRRNAKLRVYADPERYLPFTVS